MSGEVPLLDRGTYVIRDTLLIVTTSYPMTGDGSEAAGSFVADFAEEMARHMPVRIVGPGLHPHVEGGGSSLPVWRFAAGKRPLSLLSPVKPWHWPEILRALMSLRCQVLAAADDGRVVHTLALWALPSGWAARVLCRKQDIPYSVWALGSDIWSIGRIRGVRRLLRAVCLDAKYAYADGYKLAQDAQSIAGRSFAFLPSTRAIRTSEVRRPRDEPPYRLLFLGRWHPNKGIDLLLEALALLDESDWQRISLVRICGGGAQEKQVRLCAANLAARGMPVVVSGYLDKRAARQAIESADYVVIPSRIESIPVIFSDSVKLGRPVIATPVGDLAQLVNGTGAGILAQGADAPSIAAAIRHAVRKSPAELAEAVASAAAQFDLGAIALRVARDMGRTRV